MCVIVSFRLNFYTENNSIQDYLGEICINFENKNYRIPRYTSDIEIVLFKMTIVFIPVTFFINY